MFKIILIIIFTFLISSADSLGGGHGHGHAHSSFHSMSEHSAFEPSVSKISFFGSHKDRPSITDDRPLSRPADSDDVDDASPLDSSLSINNTTEHHHKFNKRPKHKSSINAHPLWTTENPKDITSINDDPTESTDSWTTDNPIEINTQSTPINTEIPKSTKKLTKIFKYIPDDYANSNRKLYFDIINLYFLIILVLYINFI
ncbi:hypothetical protein ACQ4LE_007382, partial [Meloidogyne hapla]|uniref:Uncharacterized protein n=1 Tax=Meloidogyne hapla TaxID=6305 RepID=A0A1I8BZG9_MELHA